MLRRKATTIRANGAKDELVRETYRLGSLVTSLFGEGPVEAEEVSHEIEGAAGEIERIDELTETLEAADDAAEMATVTSLADAAAAARKRHRRLRSIRRRLLSEQDQLAA